MKSNFKLNWGRSKAQEVPLREHLINQLSDVYMPGEASTLRKDVEELFTPYGFRDRRDNVRLWTMIEPLNDPQL